MRKTTPQVAVTVALLLVTSWASAHRDKSEASADEIPSTVASNWFEQSYEVVKDEMTTPPAASRIYGITAVALYESIVGGTKRHQSLAGQLNGFTSVPQPQKDEKYHWPTVANAVFANTIRGLYPTISKPRPASQVGKISALRASPDADSSQV